MIWYTIPQAAARVRRKPDTIRKWIRQGWVTAIRNPIDGNRYIPEGPLLEAERRARLAAAETRRVAGDCAVDLRGRDNVPPSPQSAHTGVDGCAP